MTGKAGTSSRGTWDFKVPKPDPQTAEIATQKGTRKSAVMWEKSEGSPEWNSATAGHPERLIGRLAEDSSKFSPGKLS